MPLFAKWGGVEGGKMLLYNSLTRSKDEFKPRVEGKVTLYTCGPTVYHFAHIGNLRTYAMEDVLDRYLRYLGYEVKRVMNVTDVGHLSSDADTGEDKMLKGARRENKTVMQIAKYYTDAFFEDLKRLNIRMPEVIEPATNCIPDFIDMVSTLLEKGYAYLAGGNVYFDTSKLDKYYVFNDFSEDDLAVGVRDSVEEDGNKKNKADFVLWFTKSKFEDQELKWDSPWGIGYPGWHIECSCIAKRHLGEYLDIHCGGIDNAFPHHTNEIAQSESAFGHEWCKHWFHVHHLNTSSGKMSKSKGEFLTVSLLMERGYDPLVYRYFCMQSHYRKNLVFTWENLDNAKKSYEKLVARIAALKPRDGEEVDALAFEEGKKRFTDALDNDLNTSLAVTALFDVFKLKTGDKTKLALIENFERVLALGLVERASVLVSEEQRVDRSDEIAPELLAFIEDRIEARRQAKANKDFALADSIRAELLVRGVTITDTREGTKFTVNN